MKNLLFGLYTFSILLVSCKSEVKTVSDTELAQFFHNKKVLFLGNSITQNGNYVSALKYLLQTEFPDIKTDIVSVGLSSETVSCLTEPKHPYPRPCLKDRIERVLAETKPDVVSVCYGMNDGIYHPQSEERMQAYRDGIQRTIKTLEGIGAKIIFLPPPPFDPNPIDKTVGIDYPEFGYAHPYEGYDEVLADYGKYLATLESEHIKYIDWHSPFNNYVQQQREENPEFTLARDGVHPSEDGHLLMAKFFLAGFKENIDPNHQMTWDGLMEDPAFQESHAQRQMKSYGLLAYTGFNAWDSVKTISPKPILILLGGQSNMVGGGKKANIESSNLPGHIRYINFGKNARLVTQTESFGPELSLGQNLAKAFHNQPFILLKYAVGGSSLLDWAYRYSAEKAEITGHPEFGNMFADFAWKIDSIEELFDVKGTALLWMQGERDARIPEAGKDYKENLSNFITDFRERMKVTDLPFIMGMVNPPADHYAALETVRKAQVDVAASLDQVYTVNTDDLEKFDDNLHYNEQGLLKLGERYGEILIPLIQEKYQE